MSDAIDSSIAKLQEKLGGADLGGRVKFVVEGTGALLVDGTQTPPSIEKDEANASDADVTITADMDVMTDMLSGNLDPTAAYMGGQLKIDGDMGLAMKMAQMLA